MPRKRIAQFPTAPAEAAAPTPAPDPELDFDESDYDLEESLAAIDEAIREAEAGETISFEDFKREIRREYGL